MANKNITEPRPIDDTIECIEALAEIVKKNDLGKIRISTEDIDIVIEGKKCPPPAPGMPMPMMAAPAAAASAPAAQQSAPAAETVSGTSSPLPLWEHSTLPPLPRSRRSSRLAIPSIPAMLCALSRA